MKRKLQVACCAIVTKVLALAVLVTIPMVATAQVFDGPLPDPLGDAEFAVLAEFFEYDRDSLAARVVPVCARGTCFNVEDRGSHTREKIIFTVPEGGEVPALLGIPAARPAPHPLVIVQYGTNGSKELFWEESHPYNAVREALNAAGFAVLAMDMPGHGERRHEIGYADGPSLILGGQQHRLRDMSVQAVIELRRALDALETRSELDLARVGSLGVSHGSLHTFYLAAVEPRVRAAVTWVTPMRKVYPLLYPGHFARQIQGAAVLMLAGDQDQFYTVEEAETVFGLLASSENRLVVFDGGHEVRPQDVPIAVGWLVEHLEPDGN